MNIRRLFAWGLRVYSPSLMRVPTFRDVLSANPKPPNFGASFGLGYALSHAEATGDIEPLVLVARHHFGYEPSSGESPQSIAEQCRKLVARLDPR